MMIGNIHSQRGAALFVALIFLVLITLISVTSMRTSTMELRMAGNEQNYRTGADSVQSASTAVLRSGEITIGADGSITCFDFGGGTPTGVTCDRTVTFDDVGAGQGAQNQVMVTMDGMAECPPGVATSLTLQRHNIIVNPDGGSGGGSCAYMSLNSRYDATESRGGRVETQQGFFRILPGG